MFNFKAIKILSYTAISIFLICFLNPGDLKSQELILSRNKSESGSEMSNKSFQAVLKNDNSPLSRLSKSNDDGLSATEKLISEKISEIKKSERSFSDGDKMIELQKEIEKTNGMTNTVSGKNDFGTLIPPDRFNPQETDNINLSYVIESENNLIAGLAAQVEQRGSSAGKIWVAVGLANGDTGMLAMPDTIGIYYSDNNGVTYNLYAKIAFSDHNKIDFDNMDMEIIENTSGTKYLHLVFSYTTNGGYGQRLIGYTVVSAPTLGYAGTTLFPPGFGLNSMYTKARITSDNARFPFNPFVTIAVTQDSVSGGQHYFMTKICRVLSPFTVSPTLKYLSKSIYSVSAGFNNSVFTDVANYHNGDDSLIFVLSSYPGYEYGLYFYKAYSNAVVYPAVSGSYIPTYDNLEYATIAANGGTNQTGLMITFSDNYFNTGDFDQWVLTTSNARNWSIASLDYSKYNSSRFGDVIGRRNADGSFAVTFKNFYGNMENISAYRFTGLNLSSNVYSLNTDYANSVTSPKPLFRYLNNDSCLNIWSSFYSVSSTSGCTSTNVYISASLEAIYDESADYHYINAPVKILLAQSSPPYSIADSAFAYLDYTSMTNVFAFPKALTGNYFLIVKYFNCIETWSAAPVSVSASFLNSYSFMTSGTQAYGNNLIQKGSRWCIYSGDVNQDGTIDLTDGSLIDNDAFNFVSGYQPTDLNSDGLTDLADGVFADNNSYNFISKITP
ncbi:MAG: hypothetical protein JSS91_14330 [Bacteroidetes bacterium]|nr:hypothetical protein [Bacteroidota bacterium]